jgi:WD40 repeat protein
MNKAINTSFRARRSRFDWFMTQKYINFLLAIFTELLNPESKTYSERIVLANLDSSVRNLDLDPVLKAVFHSQGPPDSAGFRFSPDGKSIAFVIEEAGGTTFGCSPWTDQKGGS